MATILNAHPHGGKGTLFHGEATFYDGNGALGACGNPIADDQMLCALNAASFDPFTPGSNPNDNALCGSCVRVTGPKGSAVCKILDRLPSGGPFDVDLTRTAFANIADISAGRVAVKWSFCRCI
ncbi:hypothetical protein HK102_011021 [Quaeritorhiza haematococci]|nr:hypothetical protein HK102_011021 [Quaeritorhiza haematococci]